jgi:hypothetical protein
MTLRHSDEFNAAADWYSYLAQQKGWLEHCRYEVQKLESDESGIYKGLRLAVRERIEKAKAEKVQSLQNPVHAK